MIHLSIADGLVDRTVEEAARNGVVSGAGRGQRHVTPFFTHQIAMHRNSRFDEWLTRAPYQGYGEKHTGAIAGRIDVT